MPTERIIQPKNPVDLIHQVVGNSRYVEELTGEPIIPPSITDVESLGNLSESVAKERFGTKRYDALVEILRSELAGHDLDEEKEWEIGRWLKLLNGIDRYTTNHYAPESNGVLYPKQMEVFEALGRFLQNGGTEGYFRLPTAFGKTYIFTEFAKAANLRTLVVVPTIEVLDQTEGTFAKLAPELELGKVYADAKDFQGQITVTTYNSFIRLVDPKNENAEEFDFLPEDIDLLILDEAHHALGSQTAHAAAQFINAIKLGFTATPFYSESRNLEKLLGTEIYGMSIKEAAEQEQLSPFKVWLAITSADLSGVEIDISTGDYNQTQLARIINTTSMNQGAVDLYEKYFDGKSTLVYCASVRHAQQVARLFRERGIKAEAAWGDMNKRKRNSLIEDFKKGEITVLCNMQLLTEGFDAPNASVCMNLRPTLSAVVAEQRGGRTLRLDPADPNKEAIIVDFIYKGESDRQQISFAEVAETAEIQNKLAGRTRAASTPRSENGDSPLSTTQSPDINLGNLQVVTEVREVMRIASQAKMQRSQIEEGIPIGYIPLKRSQLAREFGVSVETVVRNVESLSEDYPEDVIRRGRNRFIILTQQGFELLGKQLEGYRIPEGYQFLDVVGIARKRGMNYSTARDLVERLGGQNLNQILHHGRNRRILISNEGLELLRKELDTVYPLRTSPINRAKLAKEYGVSVSTVGNRLADLAERYPSAIVSTGKGRTSRATEEGMRLIKEYLNHILIPEGYERIQYREFTIPYNLTYTQLAKRLLGLRKAYPQHFIIGTGTVSPAATPEGIALLKQTLERYRAPISEGYSRIESVELVEEFDVIEGRVYRIIADLRDQYPDLFLRRRNKGGPTYTTEKGIELIRQNLERVRGSGSTRGPIEDSETIPEDFELIPLEKLTAEYGIPHYRLRDYLLNLRKISPDHFKAWRRKTIATEEGVTLVRRYLTQAMPPEGYSEIPYEDLLKKYGVSPTLMQKRVKSLSEQYPHDVVRRGTGLTTIATSRGIDLLEQSLTASQPPKGYMELNTAELAQEYGLKYATANEHIRKISEMHPQHFIKRGSRKPFITEQGLALIREHIQGLKVPEGYSTINPPQLAEEYGVHYNVVHRQISRLAHIYPADFQKGKLGQQTIVTPQGKQLLTESLAYVRAPEGYSRLRMSQLATAHGLTIGQVYNLVIGLSETYPNDFIRQGGNKPIFNTKHGLSLLEKQLQLATSYKAIPVMELAEKYGFNFQTVRKHVARLRRQYPEHFAKKGATARGPLVTTDEGILLLDQYLENIRPTTQTIIRPDELAEAYNLTRSVVVRIIRDLNTAYPQQIIRRGKNIPLSSTTEGLHLLEEELKKTQVPEGYMEVPTIELAEEYNLGVYTVHKAVARLNEQNQEAIVRRGVGKSYIATSEGMELLRNELVISQSRKRGK